MKTNVRRNFSGIVFEAEGSGSNLFGLPLDDGYADQQLPPTTPLRDKLAALLTDDSLDDDALKTALQNILAGGVGEAVETAFLGRFDRKQHRPLSAASKKYATPGSLIAAFR